MKRIALALCFLASFCFPVESGSLTLLGAGKPPGGGGGGFSLTAGTNAGSATTSVTSINYGTVTYGSGCNAVLFLIYWYNTLTTNVVSSVTANGSSTGIAQVTGVFNHAGINGGPSIDAWQWTGPSGSSATIVVNYSGNVTFNSNVTPYCVKTTTTTPSGSSTNGIACNGATPITGTATVPAGGAAAVMASDQSGSILTFGGATQDGSYTGGGAQDAWAHTTTTGSVSLSATPLASDNCTLGWVSYGP